jgi:uncharacterized membrane protein YdjX (TVP38/TMEM64 family)
MFVAAWPVIFFYTIMLLACGFLYGPGRGFALGYGTSNVCAFLVGSAASPPRARLCGLMKTRATLTQVFLLCRYQFRRRVERFVLDSPLLRRLDVRMHREGWKLAVVVRLAGVPFGVVNVLLSVTQISPLQFVVATAAGTVPPAVIGTLLGSTLKDISDTLSEGMEWTTTRIAIFVTEVVIAGTFVLTTLFLSRKMLAETLREANEEQAAAAGAAGADTEIMVVQSSAGYEAVSPVTPASLGESSVHHRSSGGNSSESDEQQGSGAQSSGGAVAMKVDAV